MLKEDYQQYYIQGSDHYLIPKDVFIELFNEMNNWKAQAMENNKYKTKLINKISENIDVDPEDYYFAEIEEKSNKYDEIEKSTKKFIKYLEVEKDRLTYTYKDSLDRIKFVNTEVVNELNIILEIYNEIIGVENENTRI